MSKLSQIYEYHQIRPSYFTGGPTRTIIPIENINKSKSDSNILEAVDSNEIVDLPWERRNSYSEYGQKRSTRTSRPSRKPMKRREDKTIIRQNINSIEDAVIYLNDESETLVIPDTRRSTLV